MHFGQDFSRAAVPCVCVFFFVLVVVFLRVWKGLTYQNVRLFYIKRYKLIYKHIVDLACFLYLLMHWLNRTSKCVKHMARNRLEAQIFRLKYAVSLYTHYERVYLISTLYKKWLYCLQSWQQSIHLMSAWTSGCIFVCDWSLLCLGSTWRYNDNVKIMENQPEANTFSALYSHWCDCINIHMISSVNYCTYLWFLYMMTWYWNVFDFTIICWEITAGDECVKVSSSRLFCCLGNEMVLGGGVILHTGRIGAFVAVHHWLLAAPTWWLQYALPLLPDYSSSHTQHAAHCTHLVSAHIKHLLTSTEGPKSISQN